MNNQFGTLLIVLLLTACASNGKAIATASATLTPPPTATATPIPPTPSSPNDSIFWDGLQVTMDLLEITQDFINEYGAPRVPAAGKKFVWVHIRLKNTNQTEMDIPISEHYSILYAALEIKPIYGHRQGYTDYTTIGTTIFPDQVLAGWLRFDIPDTAAFKDMRFVFIPESAEVGTSYSSPNYPYAPDKPTYVWNCTP